MKQTNDDQYNKAYKRMVLQNKLEKIKALFLFILITTAVVWLILTS